MDLKEALDPGAVDVVRHPWELARYKVVRDLLKTHADIHTRQGLNILDMGCGDSWFVEQLAQDFSQHSYTGVDIAFTQAQLARIQTHLSEAPIQLFTSLDEAATSLQPKVDIVLLLDVIEHIEDEIAFLKWMQTFEVISPQTQFFITVPAFQSLFCQHDVFLEHYRRYNTRMMRDHLAQSQMEIAQQGYFFASLLGPRLIQVGLQRIQRPPSDDEAGVGQWQGGKGATKAFTQLLWRDYQLGRAFRKIGLKTPGLSHFAIASPHA